MTNTLFILNDGPHGTERSYNALRVAGALSAREGEHVRVFLMADGVQRRTLAELTSWTQWAEKVLVF